jgi:hypothetical protein
MHVRADLDDQLGVTPERFLVHRVREPTPSDPIV